MRRTIYLLFLTFIGRVEVESNDATLAVARIDVRFRSTDMEPENAYETAKYSVPWHRGSRLGSSHRGGTGTVWRLTDSDRGRGKGRPICWRI